jgi:hypothetical protein
MGIARRSGRAAPLPPLSQQPWGEPAADARLVVQALQDVVILRNPLLSSMVSYFPGGCAQAARQN